jgi:hypothetical protein
MIHWLWEPVGFKVFSPYRRFLSTFMELEFLIQTAACSLNCVACPLGLPRRNTRLRTIIPALEHPRRLLLAGPYISAGTRIPGHLSGLVIIDGPPNLTFRPNPDFGFHPNDGPQAALSRHGYRFPRYYPGFLPPLTGHR